MKFRLNSLNEWFKELGITIDYEILDKELKTFDGIPVWLTFFGNEFVRCVKDLIKITEIAINLAFEEPENLVREGKDMPSWNC